MVTVLPCIIREDFLKMFDVFCIAIPILMDTVRSCQPDDRFFRDTLPDPSESRGDLVPVALVPLYLLVGVG